MTGTQLNFFSHITSDSTPALLCNKVLAFFEDWNLTDSSALSPQYISKNERCSYSDGQHNL